MRLLDNTRINHRNSGVVVSVPTVNVTEVHSVSEADSVLRWRRDTLQMDTKVVCDFLGVSARRVRRDQRRYDLVTRNSRAYVGKAAGQHKYCLQPDLATVVFALNDDHCLVGLETDVDLVRIL